MIHSATQSSKFVKLVRKLRPLVPPGPFRAEMIAVAVLEKLWHTTMSSAPRGDIGRIDDESIAESIGFDGDAGLLISILVECGWIDKSDEHRLIVHDWHEHAPRHVKQNIGRKGGFVTERPVGETNKPPQQSVRDVEQPLSVSPETVSTEISRAPNQTKPNQTKSNSFYTEAGKQPSVPEFNPAECRFPEFPCCAGASKSESAGPWKATPDQLIDWQETYPGIVVSAEHRKAHAWVMANLTKRKTKQGMLKFLNGWFAKAQNESARGSPSNAQGRPEVRQLERFKIKRD